VDPELRIVASQEALAAEGAARVIQAGEQALAQRGRFLLGLSGGRTPAALYRQLAAEPLRSALDWSHVTLVLTDERRVPKDDARSNQRMIEEQLLSGLPRNVGVIWMDGADPDGDRAARRYEEQLREASPDGAIDLLLLGMGPDCHTASLFPGNAAALQEPTRWALPVQAPPGVTPNVDRLTVTPVVIERAREIVVLVEGSEKASALRQALAGEGSELRCPIRVVHRCRGPVTFLCDQQAAAELNLPQQD
jgi:6-phosphogluconolactonase